MRWRRATGRGTSPLSHLPCRCPDDPLYFNHFFSLAVAGKPFSFCPDMVTKMPPHRPGRTKADLIDAVYDRHGGLTKNEAAEIVDTIFKTVKTSLADGRPVKIKNFGTFEITRRPGRLGVNPVSGERIFIRPHRGLSFKPARRLKDEMVGRQKE
ncbi:HU family DNA-binding protein [bacterium]|nr:MAG: HU family DNA-binding protein [bacterium]